jgi:hypothetical protein
MMLEWDIGHQEITCKNTKSMSLWYESLIRILWTTCDKLLETICGQPNQQLQLQDSFITLRKIYIGDDQSIPIVIGRSVKQEMAKKWKWFRRQWIWVAYLKIWCKLGCISRTKRKNTRARGGGGKNTIVIDIWRRRKLKKWGSWIFWVMQWNHCWFVASNEEGVTIIYLRLQEHTQMSSVYKIVNIPFFIRIWECMNKSTWNCW